VWTPGGLAAPSQAAVAGRCRSGVTPDILSHFSLVSVVGHVPCGTISVPVMGAEGVKLRLGLTLELPRRGRN
jgi:hypothetical protein